MASKTVTKYFSDLSDKEIEGGVATVTFALNSKTYEIDLTQAEQKTLRDALAPYIEAGRAKLTPPRRTSGSLPRQIREWAIESGYEVPKRGRIPKAITDAYEAAH